MKGTSFRRVVLASHCLIFVLFACQKDENNEQDLLPCARSSPPAECSVACQTDQDCASSYFCGAANTCTVECTAEHNTCGATMECGPRGRCVTLISDSGSVPLTDLLNCPDVMVELEPVIPDVLLLIDQSGSMTENFGRIGGKNVNRWVAVRYALTDAQHGAVTQLQQAVRFGAVLYHSTGGSAGGVCPILTKSPGTPPGQPQLNNREAIDNLFANNTPVKDTPTAESINSVVTEMKAWQANPDAPLGPKVLLLATDGDPDTCDDPDAHNQVSRDLSEAAVQAAYQEGIFTYVLSVGSDVLESHLERLANAGVGKPLTPPDAPFYRGNNPDELVSAFNQIIGRVRTCTFTLDAKVEVTYQNSGQVTFNGTLLQQGVDWELKDSSTIALLGQACEDFLSSTAGVLSAQFPCGAIIE